VLVSTSDHETGGLAAARQIHEAYPMYRWFPEVLANATHSSEWLSAQWHSFLDSSSSLSHKDKETKIAELLTSGLGINDYSQEEIDAVIDAKPTWPPSYLFADMISRRAQVGWSTHGHSAVDVNIYASHPKHAPGLIGNHENIEVGEFIAAYLDLDLKPITAELKEKKVKTSNAEGQEIEAWGEWMGPPGLSVNDNGLLLHLDEYHGDFKHRKREAELGLECGCGLKH